MGIDLTRIDEDIRRLSLVKQVMSDPKAVGIIEELLRNRNGSGPTPNRTPPTSDNNSSVSRVRQSIGDNSGEFTLTSVCDTLAKGTSSVDKSAVGKILAYLVKNGEIRVVRQEGHSNIYIKTEKLRV